MLILVGLVIIVAVTVATAFFVAQEFAYVAVDRSRLAQLAEAGDKQATRALKVTARLSFMLSGAQLGITVTALFVGFFAEPYLGQGLAAAFGDLGVPESVGTVVAMVLTLLFANVVQMVLGELAPKNLAIAETVALSRWLSAPTLVYLAIAGPVIRFFDSVSNWLLRSVGIEPVEELPHGASADDLHHIIDESREGGHIDAELSRILDNGLDFRELTAGQVMTPRVDVDTIDADVPVSHLVDLLATGRSRFPVVGDDIDDVVGVVGIAEAVTVPRDRRDGVRVRDIAAPPLLIPESLPLPDVLERLRAEHRQQACVLDEYGGLAGVVSFEDVAEELVGDIRDEDDRPAERVIHRTDGSWLVPARLRVDEVADATGVQLPEDDDYETLGGLVMDALGRIPHSGDVVDVRPVSWTLQDESGNGDGTPPLARLRVVSVRRHVPKTVAVQLVDAGGAEVNA
ncbi:CBS domain containing-hemolysin-like protein [Stackebrandtia albiflava]|uniref:CBS domain containing-hemolysin-like protein n=1 Tax=Stackebrandtia albiflava TaxID=406432 RepID=A0A562V240_9ACTN|nr:hemolysin family protein [Stackebrandtia albiflava]TWJ11905.1 CBS domain containing-hemolysin-like protein [Stackebrandtia albiflava]